MNQMRLRGNGGMRGKSRKESGHLIVVKQTIVYVDYPDAHLIV